MEPRIWLDVYYCEESLGIASINLRFEVRTQQFLNLKRNLRWYGVTVDPIQQPALTIDHTARQPENLSR